MRKITALILILISTLNILSLEKIYISGSTTVYPLAKRCSQAFMKKNKNIKITVSPGGSGVGISDLINERVEIANASRKIKESEIQLAKSKKVIPFPHLVARDGIAVVVHPTNSIKNLSINSLQKIYSGEITNWSELGGKNQEISVISRDIASGTYAVFKSIVLKKEELKEASIMVASNQAVADVVSQTKSAIGYIGLEYLSERLKNLSINNISPDPSTIRKGTYPLSRPLYMYTNSFPKDETKNFIQFVKSKEGQEIAKKVGYVPIR